MNRPDLEAALVDLYQRGDELAEGPELLAVRQALGLALRAVALGGTARGDRARELLAEAHRASMGAPATVEAALVDEAPELLAVRPVARRDLTMRRRSAPARTEA